MEKIFIQSGGYERHIGDLYKERKRFVKQVDSRVHKFRALDAYGIDSKFLEKRLLRNNYTIYLHEVDTGNWYKVSAEIFKKEGQYYHFKSDNIDNNTQIFLPIEKWHKLDEIEVYNINFQ